MAIRTYQQPARYGKAFKVYLMTDAIAWLAIVDAIF
jgi:hypothetical protein